MLATLQHLRVKALMTPFLYVVGADWPLHQIAAYMIAHEITGAPVADENGTLIGVVSQTDVLRYLTRPAQNSAPTAADLMTATLFRIDEETPVQEAAMLMRNGHLHRLFVTRGGRVVGIVSAFGLLKVIQGMLDQVVIEQPAANPLEG